MKQFIAFLLICCASVAAKAQYKNLTYKFDFGSGKVEQGHIQVTEQQVYTDKIGFGFDYNTTATAVSNKGKNPITSDYCTSKSPFYFSVAVPDGIYRVQITLGNKDVQTLNTIKAEARRLMVYDLRTEVGEFTTVTFNVSVRTPLLPNGKTVRLKASEMDGHPSWDNKLTLEFNGENPSICSLEVMRVADVTTVYICGDSTVCDQSKEPWSGWGMMLPCFFNNNICISNQAQSGLTLLAFEGQRRLEKVLSMISPGDYMFIQFAHNDMKPGAKTPSQTVYKEMLKKYAKAAKEKGAQPVFVTSMHRRAFNENGELINTLEDYPEAMKAVAQELDIPLIDLNAMSKTFYEAMGVEGSKKAFVHYPAHTFPGQEDALADNSHFNAYGAMQLAKCVVEGMKQNQLNLVQNLQPWVTAYNPATPDDPGTCNVPVSPVFDMTKPDGN